MTGSGVDVEVIRARLGVETVFRLESKYLTPRALGPVDPALLEPRARKVVAVAGIARPERFFAALRALGWDVSRALAFRDHRWFTPRDLDTIRRAVVDSGADLVMTTEKDAVRVPAQHDGGVPWAYLPLELAVEPSDGFSLWLAGRLAAARRRRIGEAA